MLLFCARELKSELVSSIDYDYCRIEKQIRSSKYGSGLALKVDRLVVSEHSTTMYRLSSIDSMKTECVAQMFLIFLRGCYHKSQSMTLNIEITRVIEPDHSLIHPFVSTSRYFPRILWPLHCFKHSTERISVISRFHQTKTKQHQLSICVHRHIAGPFPMSKSSPLKFSLLNTTLIVVISCFILWITAIWDYCVAERCSTTTSWGVCLGWLQPGVDFNQIRNGIAKHLSLTLAVKCEHRKVYIVIDSHTITRRLTCSWNHTPDAIQKRPLTHLPVPRSPYDSWIILFTFIAKLLSGPCCDVDAAGECSAQCRCRYSF